MTAGDVLIAGEGVADQDRVALGGVESAVGLISDGQRREIDSRLHRQRAVGPEPKREAVRRVGLARGAGPRDCAGFTQDGPARCARGPSQRVLFGEQNV